MTDAPITQQEMTAILEFFKKHDIAWIGNDGNRNGATFGEFFDRWSGSGKTIPFTPQTLEIAFKKLQEAGSLIFYSPDETQYHIYQEHYPAELETIRRFLPTYSLSATTEDESLYVNINIIMEYCITTGRVHQITHTNLQTLIMGNLMNRPGVRALRWGARPKQDWEIERDRKAEEAEKAAEAYRKYHKELSPEFQEEQRRKREAEEIKTSNQSYWEQRTRSFINSIQSHVQRAEAEALFGKQKYGNWEITFRELETWHDRKKNQGGHWY